MGNTYIYIYYIYIYNLHVPYQYGSFVFSYNQDMNYFIVIYCDTV